LAAWANLNSGHSQAADHPESIFIYGEYEFENADKSRTPGAGPIT